VADKENQQNVDSRTYGCDNARMGLPYSRTSVTHISGHQVTRKMKTSVRSEFI
jgi:hypothetical protein